MEENAGADGLSTSESVDSSSLAAVSQPGKCWRVDTAAAFTPSIRATGAGDHFAVGANRAAGAVARTSATIASAIKDCVPDSHRKRTHCQVAT